MASLWSLTKPFYQISLMVGLISLILGSILTLLFNRIAPGPILLAIGSSELILGLVGYIYGLSSGEYGFRWPNATGIALIIGGFLLSAAGIFFQGMQQAYGIIGLSLFTVGTPLLVSYHIRTRATFITGFYLVGSGLILIGTSLLIAYLILGGGPWMYPAVAPAISGFEVIFFSRIRGTFTKLNKDVTVGVGQ